MVKWTAEKDQILLKGVFNHFNIKCTNELLQSLAEEIGEDCTAKAVSHRLTNIRKTGKPTAKPGDNPPATPKHRAGIAKSSTPGSGSCFGSGASSGRGRGRGRPFGGGTKPTTTPLKHKTMDDESQTEDGDEAIEQQEQSREPTPTPSRTMRARHTNGMSYAESEDEDEAEFKRIKTEPGLDWDYDSEYAVLDEA